MDKKTVKEFQEKLRSKRQELTKGYERSKSEAVETSSGGSEDFVDYAVNAYTKEFLLSLSDLDRRTLLRVDEAMARLQRGEFGVCLECGKEIGDKRLHAVPWTPYCITCQEQVEQEESRATQNQSRSLLE
jgi:DnaK suppressor protein